MTHWPHRVRFFIRDKSALFAPASSRRRHCIQSSHHHDAQSLPAMSDDRRTTDSVYAMTRERLAQGTLLQALRADPPAGMTVRSDAELERTLRATLDRHAPGRDLHVFAYGSLMWNPALDVAGSSVARVDGWHRAFCLRLVIARGTPEQPGAMLALDRGGKCDGVLYRIDAAKSKPNCACCGDAKCWPIRTNRDGSRHGSTANRSAR